MAMALSATTVHFARPSASAIASKRQPQQQLRLPRLRASSLTAENANAGENAATEETPEPVSAAAAVAATEGTAEPVSAAQDAPSADPNKLSKKAKLALRASNKQLLSLRFLWMEKNIGIGLDQVVPGHGTIPLSPFYFWPKKDAWEELKALLESKPWISRRRTIILLNQATDIINLWQQKASSF